MDRKFMEEATRLAIESVEKGWGGPFGAVIVKDGEVIGRGQNRVLLTGCPVFHAEITAIAELSLCDIACSSSLAPLASFACWQGRSTAGPFH